MTTAGSRAEGQVGINRVEPFFQFPVHHAKLRQIDRENSVAAVARARKRASIAGQSATGLPAKKSRIIDIDLPSYFDNVRHDRLLAKVARRVADADVMRLLKIMLKANGQRGVPQGGVISPLLSNLYLTEVDGMLERAKETTRFGKYTYIE